MESKLSINWAKNGYVIDPTFRAAGLVHCFSTLGTVCPVPCEASPKGCTEVYTFSAISTERGLDPFTSVLDRYVLF